MSDQSEFLGSKAVLICDDRIAVIRRDDFNTIPWPGRIDLPGGLREGTERPEVCASREVCEEIGIEIDPGRYCYREFKADSERRVWFLVARITEEEANSLKLGDEGQACWMMDLGQYLAAPDAIPHQQDWVRDAVVLIRQEGRAGSDRQSSNSVEP